MYNLIIKKFILNLLHFIAAFISAKIAARFNIPVLPWGQATATELAYGAQYTTTISVLPNVHLLENFYRS